MIVDIKDLEKLREQMPVGSVKEIAKRSGYTTAFISGVLHGKNKSLKVMQIAVDYVKEVKAKEQIVRSGLTEVIESNETLADNANRNAD